MSKQHQSISSISISSISSGVRTCTSPVLTVAACDESYVRGCETLFVCLFVGLFVYLFVCLFVCLFV